MRAFRRLSIRGKLVAVMTGVSSAIAVCGILTIFVNHAFSLHQDLRHNTVLNAQMVAQYCVVPLTFGYEEEVRDALGKLTAVPSILRASVYDHDGRLFAAFPDDNEHARSVTRSTPMPAHRFDQGVLHVYEPIVYEGREYGIIYMRVTTAHLRRRIAQELLFMLPVLFVLFLCSYLIAGRLQRPISEPIRGLADAAQDLAVRQDYSVRVHTDSEDEIGTLYQRFNYLCEQIEGRERERDAAAAEIRKLNESLERRIRDRTADLERMNVELRTSTEAAQAATKAKGDFLANMSHEIRTPMNAVLGFTRLALNAGPPAKLRNYLDKIDTAAQSLLGIINDILDFSKIEAGKVDIESTEFSLDAVTRQVLNVFGVQAQQKGLRLHFDIHPDVPTDLVGDPLRLRQVITNLVGNAIKFTDAGQVELRGRLLGRKADKVTVEFAVSDTGIGMNEKLTAEVFDAFTQADTSATRRFGGTGLGLAICKQLVGLLGGEIHVESQEGKGTTFRFTAVFGQTPGTRMDSGSARSTLSGLNVLVVDDESSIRKQLSRMLEGFSVKTAAVESAEEALTALTDAGGQPFDVVFMDYLMVSMDGLQAADHVRELRADSDLPRIILMSGYWDSTIARGVEEKRVDHYLAKPVSPSSLFEAIMHVLPDHAARYAKAAQAPPLTTVPNLRGARLLLVEDNALNQEVALGVLADTLCDVTIASNGQEALNAVMSEPFDVVLMDVQMPVMDGYAATRAIREWERECSVFSVTAKQSDDGTLNTEHSLPIIAMTAHAMAGDAEKSLAAGMNDHVTKPIDPNELFAALLKWVRPRPGLDPAPADTANAAPRSKPRAPRSELPAALPGIDVDDGLRRVNGKQDVYQRVLLRIRTDYADARADIERLLDDDTAEEAQRLVHSIKGVAGNVGAKDLQAAAAAVEAAIRSGQSDGLPGLLTAFGAALDVVVQGLAVLESQQAPPVADSATVAARQEMLEALQALEPHLQSRKPKPCRAAMGELEALSWPQNMADDAAELGKLVRKYRFKQALALVQALLEKLD